MTKAYPEEMIDDATGKVYLPPCQKGCPVEQDIQRTNTMIASLPPYVEQASHRIIEIGNEMYDKNPLFPICGYICGLCEKQCNYEEETGAVRRRMLERFVADHYLSYLDKAKPPLSPPHREKVALIGGGLASLMCAYVLSKKGYRCTIFERDSQLGGALNYIPRYRLPKDVVDITINSLVKIAHIDVQLGVTAGDGGKTLDQLEAEGYRVIFVATGTHLPRPLTFGRELVAGEDLEGVMFGLNLLYDVNYGKVPGELFEGKRVIVVGGGNVAFDVARTARRLGGDITIICLENEDKSSKDGIPADIEEIEGAYEEGLKIVFSRGIQEIIGEDGRFRKVKCPRCTSVWGENGIFNPQFDLSEVIYLEGDILLVTIGQAPERAFLQQEGLLDERGRLDIDPLTLMSNRQEGIFCGGDVRRVGFAAEAIKDGMIAAESINRYLKGENLRAGREKEYEDAPLPKLSEYQLQPKLKWKSAEERLNFEMFEAGFTLEEATEEAERCLHCGPCMSCKACVALEFQPEIPEIEVKQDICSACGICTAVCKYEAIKIEETGKGLASVIDDLKCKRCGVCVAACPSGAIVINDGFEEVLFKALAMTDSAHKIIVFYCIWSLRSEADLVGTSILQTKPNLTTIQAMCLGRIHPRFILHAFARGYEGVLLIGCKAGNCHYVNGDHVTRRRIALLKSVLSQLGVDPQRLHVEPISVFETTKLESLVNGFVDKYA